MVDRSPSEIAGDASQHISDQGWVSFIRDRGVGGVFYAFVLGAIALVTAGFNGVINVIQDFREAFSGLFSATFESAADIMAAGGDTSASSFLDGGASALGPLAWPVSVAASLAGVYVAWWFYQRINFNPVSWISGRAPWR